METIIERNNPLNGGCDTELSTHTKAETIPEALERKLVSLQDLSLLLQRKPTYLKRVLRDAGVVAFGDRYLWEEVEGFWRFRSRALQDKKSGIEPRHVRYERINRDWKKFSIRKSS